MTFEANTTIIIWATSRGDSDEVIRSQSGENVVVVPATGLQQTFPGELRCADRNLLFSAALPPSDDWDSAIRVGGVTTDLVGRSATVFHEDETGTARLGNVVGGSISTEWNGTSVTGNWTVSIPLAASEACYPDSTQPGRHVRPPQHMTLIVNAICGP